MQIERIKEADAAEERSKDEKEFKGLIEHQARVIAEIRNSIFNYTNTPKGRTNFVKANSKIGDLKMRLGRGRLFEFSQNH